MKKTAFVSLVCVALLALAVPAHAASGDLDAGFDGDGIFTFGLANPAEEGASGIAVDPSTGDLVVGNANYPSNLAVTLVQAAGGVDTAFGGGTAQFPGVQTRITNAVAAQPDGKILVAGNAGSSGEHVFLARYRPNGNPDGSFGDNGLAKATVCGDTAYETNVFVRSDGSIAVVGDCGNGSDHNKLFVLVFRPGGGLDGSFSGDGMYQLAVGDNFWLGHAVLDDHDRLTIVGRSHVGSGDERATIVRLTPQGMLDTAFAGDGRAFFDFTSGDDFARAVIARGNGVLVAEEGSFSTNSDIILFALTPQGKLDTSFSGDGKARLDIATTDTPVGRRGGRRRPDLPGRDLHVRDGGGDGPSGQAERHARHELRRHRIRAHRDVILGGLGDHVEGQADDRGLRQPHDRLRRPGRTLPGVGPTAGRPLRGSPEGRLDRLNVLGNPAPRCTGCGCTERVTVGP